MKYPSGGFLCGDGQQDKPVILVGDTLQKPVEGGPFPKGRGYSGQNGVTSGDIHRKWLVGIIELFTSLSRKTPELCFLVGGSWFSSQLDVELVPNEE
jgi:hypothetical protein